MSHGLLLLAQRVSWSMKILSADLKSITNPNVIVPPALFYTLPYRHQRRKMWL